MRDQNHCHGHGLGHFQSHGLCLGQGHGLGHGHGLVHGHIAGFHVAGEQTDE